MSSQAELIFDAIANGDIDRVVSLLERSGSLASVRAESDRLFANLPHWLYIGDTPLHLASAALMPDIARVLLRSRAVATATNRRGAAPLHYACDARPRLGVWDPIAQTETIDVLVSAGAQVNLPDAGGATPLHRAVRARSVAAVERLLFHGADVNAKSYRSGATPLHIAVVSSGASGTANSEQEQVQIIVALLNHGAQPSATDRRGRTVLAAARSRPIAQLLSSPR